MKALCPHQPSCSLPAAASRKKQTRLQDKNVTKGPVGVANSSTGLRAAGSLATPCPHPTRSSTPPFLNSAQPHPPQPPSRPHPLPPMPDPTLSTPCPNPTLSAPAHHAPLGPAFPPPSTLAGPLLLTGPQPALTSHSPTNPFLTCPPQPTRPSLPPPHTKSCPSRPVAASHL